MAINLDNRVIHRFIRDISEYELGGEFYSQIIPLDTQAYAIYPNEEDNYLFYVIGDGEHTYTELRDGKGNGPAYKEYPVLTSENLGIMIGGVEEEAKKRKEADDSLRLQIEKEVSERKEFDELLDEALGEEIQNRESSENAILDVINNHIENKENPHDVTAEQIGLGNVDNTSDLDKPISTATQAAIDELLGNITDEVTAREVADELLQDAITDEETRAKSVEDFLQGQIDEINIDDLLQAIHDETDRATNAETDLQTAIESEEIRAKQAESLLSTAISGKQDQLTEPQLQAVNSGVTDSIVAQVDTNRSDVQTIRSIIPNAATSENQLADKSFVTDKIAKESATFRGTYNSLEELNAHSGEKDNNDYAYVISIDESGNKFYNEYKYDGNSWVYEFTLSGSTFTSEQWESINSGITSGLVDKITTNETAIVNINNSAPMLSGITSTKVSNYDSHLENTSNPHNVTAEQIGLGNVDNTADLDKPISTATQNALDLKANENDLNEHVSNSMIHVTEQEKVQWNSKQDQLTAGNNISIENGIISAIDTTYTAGDGISIDNGIISNTQTQPVVNNATITFMQGDINRGTITLNQANDATITFSTSSTQTSWDDIADKPEFSTVAISGDYDDLTNKPTIPVIDQTYDQTSSNAQSGIAIAEALSDKQDALTAGQNIQIDNGVISATDTVYTAGNGISIENGVISNTQTSAEWGNITGTLSDQTDLQNALNNKQDTLVSGINIKTINNQSLLGEGNLVIQGGSGTSDYDQLENRPQIAGITLTGNKSLSDLGIASQNDLNTAIEDIEAKIPSITGLATEAYVDNAVSTKQNALTPGTGITIENNIISATGGIAQWGSITGNIADQEDLQNLLNEKQDKIDDLDQIRSNAALGATAVQSGDDISRLNNDIGYQSSAQVASAISTALSDYTTTTDLNAALAGKQDIITDLADIRSGAAAGATALQTITSSDITSALGYTPYDSSNPDGFIDSSALTPYVLAETLSSVATSGSYNDLVDKPTIPVVNDSTITINQGGVTKGSFTLNQNGDAIINLDAGGSSEESVWGNITGTLSDQEDLQTALDTKANQATTYTKSEVDDLLGAIVVATIYNYEENE